MMPRHVTQFENIVSLIYECKSTDESDIMLTNFAKIIIKEIFLKAKADAKPFSITDCKTYFENIAKNISLRRLPLAENFILKLFDDPEFIEKAKEKANYVTGYVTLTVDQAKENKNYWRLFQRLYQEIAIQSFLSSEDKKKKLLLIEPPQHKLCFIKEAQGSEVIKKVAEHREKINTGLYAQLDFTDPEYIRNMYMLFRLSHIDEDQLVTALTTKMFFDQFSPSSTHPILYEEPLDETSTFDPFQNVSVVATEKKDLFDALKGNDKYYFYMDFTNLFTAAFLYYFALFLLTSKTRENLPKVWDTINRALEIYIARHAFGWEKDLLLFNVKNMHTTGHSKSICEFIRKKEPLLNKFLRGEDDFRERYPDLANEIIGAKHTAIIVKTGTEGAELPTLYFSPHYKPDDTKSPTISMMLLPSPTFKHWLTILYKQNAILPRPLVGQIQPVTMRDVDEGNFIFPENARPAWILHPDVATYVSIHGQSVNPFWIFFHDWYHATISSANPFGHLLRHICEDVLVNGKKIGEGTRPSFLISKTIWKLIDREFSTNFPSLKSGLKSENPVPTLRVILITIIEESFSQDFFSSPAKHDDNLLLFIDLVKNEKTWEEALHITPEDHLAEEKLMKIVPYLKNIKELVTSYPDRSNVFYILLYRLGNTKANADLCQELENRNYKGILHWTRNSGLFLDVSKNSERCVAKITGGALFAELSARLKAIKAGTVAEQKKIKPRLFNFRHKHHKTSTTDDKPDQPTLSLKPRSYV